MNPKLRAFFTNLALLAASVALALALVEWVLGWTTQSEAQRRARQLRVPYDARDRLDVILENRKADPNWYPAVPANTYLERPLRIRGERLLPLGGVANANVVGCNESGYFSTFVTDEYGFNNPPGTWRTGPARKIFLVGDSFTQGDCLRDGDTIAGHLRKVMSGIVNLGSGGNGPLLELAGIREYVPDGGVGYVFWLYYEGNDLTDLARDRRDPILASYVTPGFSQRLQERQEEINGALRAAVDARLTERLDGRATVLPRLRGEIWRARQRLGSGQRDGSAPPNDVAFFAEALAVAKAEVERKGGKLVFVYLPEFYRFAGDQLSEPAALKPQVVDAVSRLGIPVLDAEPAFRRRADPTELFPFQVKAHYNAEGTALVAALIRDFLADKDRPQTN